jgi:hypothetical protein
MNMYLKLYWIILVPLQDILENIYKILSSSSWNRPSQSGMYHYSSREFTPKSFPHASRPMHPPFENQL